MGGGYLVTFRRIRWPVGVNRCAENYGFTFTTFAYCALLGLIYLVHLGGLCVNDAAILCISMFSLPFTTHQHCRLVWLLIRCGWDLRFLSVFQIGVSGSSISGVKLVPRSCFRQSHGRRYPPGPGLWAICADLGQWVLASGVTSPVSYAHMATSPDRWPQLRCVMPDGPSSTL